MPDPADIPVNVVRFVHDNLESLEQLELLALLVKSPDRWWDPASVGQVLGITAATARHALESLASRNLLAISITADVRYRFQPGDSRLRESARDLSRASEAIALVLQVVGQKISFPSISLKHSAAVRPR